MLGGKDGREGVRRLSLAVGIIGVIVFLIPAVIAVGDMWSKIGYYKEQPGPEDPFYEEHEKWAWRVGDSMLVGYKYSARERWNKTTEGRRTMARVREALALHKQQIRAKKLETAEHALYASVAVVVGAVLSFLAPWSIVRGIDWIVAGFRKGSEAGDG